MKLFVIEQWDGVSWTAIKLYKGRLRTALMHTRGALQKRIRRVKSPEEAKAYVAFEVVLGGIEKPTDWVK